MHVLIVTQYFWPEDFRINDLAVGLVEKGHRVTVLTGIPNYPAGRFFPGYGVLSRRREIYQGIEILRVPLIPRGRGRGFRLFINYISFALLACAMGPLLCRGSYDVIFVYEPSPVTVGLPARAMKMVKGAPIIFWVQDLWPESLSATGAVSSQWILRIVERLVRFIYRGCDQILVQSRGFIPTHPADGGGCGTDSLFSEQCRRVLPPREFGERRNGTGRGSGRVSCDVCRKHRGSTGFRGNSLCRRYSSVAPGNPMGGHRGWTSRVLGRGTGTGTGADGNRPSSWEAAHRNRCPGTSLLPMSCWSPFGKIRSLPLQFPRRYSPTWLVGNRSLPRWTGREPAWLWNRALAAPHLLEMRMRLLIRSWRSIGFRNMRGPQWVCAAGNTIKPISTERGSWISWIHG